MPKSGRPPVAAADFAPDPEAIRAALARIIESDPFRSAPQLVAFLSFVVERTLEGRAGEIKGYTIATEALGRPEDFDPQADPIVRVEAGRLRRALQAYYAGVGAGEPVRIAIPVGSYVPRFETPDLPAQGEGGDPPPIAPMVEPRPAASPGPAGRLVGPGGLRWPLAAAAMLLIGFIGAAVAIGLSRSGEESRGPSLATGASTHPLETRPVVVVQPIATAGSLPDRFSPTLLREALLDALDRFDEIVVTERPVGELPLSYGLRLVVVARDEGLAAKARLTHLQSGAVLWSREFPLTPTGSAGTAEQELARQVARILAPPYGVIHADLRASAPEGSSARCVVRAYDFRYGADEARHAEARDCLEALIAANPNDHLAHALLAQLYLVEHQAGLNPRPDPLERALQAARRAVELAPESARAHLAMMSVLYVRGETGEALRAGHRAVEMNPHDPCSLAELGVRYVQAGAFERGVSLLDRAMEAAPGAPPRYRFYKFVAAYLRDDHATARALASSFVGEDFVLGFVARAVMAQREGDEAQARRFVHKIAAAVPHLVPDAHGTLRRLGFSDPLAERLAGDLAKAGLASVHATFRPR